jgi:hypothetical protein
MLLTCGGKAPRCVCLWTKVPRRSIDLSFVSKKLVTTVRKLIRLFHLTPIRLFHPIGGLSTQFADKVVELGLVDRTAEHREPYESRGSRTCLRERFNYRAHAQKNILQPHRRQCWVIPPKANSAS